MSYSGVGGAGKLREYGDNPVTDRLEAAIPFTLYLK